MTKVVNYSDAKLTNNNDILIDSRIKIMSVIHSDSNFASYQDIVC